MHSLAAIGNALRSAISRAAIAASSFSATRTLLQIKGLADDARVKVELFLPYGMSALPTAGEVIVLQINGSRDHVVGLQADDPALRILDLQKGEYGFRDLRGQMVVFRQDRIQIVTPLDLDATVGGNVNASVSGQVNLTVAGKVVGSAAEWDLTGDVKVTGNITATGNITDLIGSNSATVGDLRAAYDAHVHPGVQSGPSSTGTPDRRV